MSRKFVKMCKVYRRFAGNGNLDFSNQAAQEMFDFESRGVGDISIDGFNTIGKQANGFAVGKKFLNITVAMWFDWFNNYGWEPQMRELYADPIFKNIHWWLDSVFKDFIYFKNKFYNQKDICEKDFILTLWNDIKRKSDG